MGHLAAKPQLGDDGMAIWIAICACCLLGIVTRNARKK